MLLWLGGAGLALFGASNEAASQGKSGGKGKGKGKGKGGGNKGKSGNSGNSGTSSQGAEPGAADDVLDQDATLEMVRQGKALPLRTLLPEIERKYRGQVIDAALRREGRKLVYTLKMLSPEGRVFVVAVNAATGRQELGFFQSFGF
jgi:hypothetical protein